MKRRINIAVVGIMLINTLLSTNVMAAVQDNQTNVTVESETVDMNNLLEGVLATTQIVIDGELMEVPVVRNIVSTRGIEEKICNTQTICIPDFSIMGIIFIFLQN